jgi:hypothetical protein
MKRSTIGIAAFTLLLLVPVSCGSSGGGTGSGGATASTGGASGTASGGTTGTGSGGTTGTGSGGTTGATTSGVQGSKRLDALTADEKKKLCDFQAQKFGGYGHSVDCGGGNSLDADASQADCVSQWPTNCAMTVSQAETCTKDVSCADPIPTSCLPLLQCS